jgi:hypothetical protein
VLLSDPGVKSKDLTGFDRAGNQTTVACTYIVGFNFLGFQEPVPQSSYKRGSTIPVKFKLGEANGTKLSDAVAQGLIAPTCLVQITLDGKVRSGCATYNATTDTFQYDLKTAKSTAAGNHTLGIQVGAPNTTGVRQHQLDDRGDQGVAGRRRAGRAQNRPSRARETFRHERRARAAAHCGARCSFSCRQKQAAVSRDACLHANAGVAVTATVAQCPDRRLGRSVRDEGWQGVRPLCGAPAPSGWLGRMRSR